VAAPSAAWQNQAWDLLPLPFFAWEVPWTASVIDRRSGPHPDSPPPPPALRQMRQPASARIRLAVRDGCAGSWAVTARHATGVVPVGRGSFTTLATLSPSTASVVVCVLQRPRSSLPTLRWATARTSNVGGRQPRQRQGRQQRRRRRRRRRRWSPPRRPPPVPPGVAVANHTSRWEDVTTGVGQTRM